eukprot:4950641-Alexandrium_andersonii.AAC.1
MRERATVSRGKKSEPLGRAVAVLTPRAEPGEVHPEVGQARGLDGLGSVLALIEVHHADARHEGEGD